MEWARVRSRRTTEVARRPRAATPATYQGPDSTSQLPEAGSPWPTHARTVSSLRSLLQACQPIVEQPEVVGGRGTCLHLPGRRLFERERQVIDAPGELVGILLADVGQPTAEKGDALFPVEYVDLDDLGYPGQTSLREVTIMCPDPIGRKSSMSLGILTLSKTSSHRS